MPTATPAESNQPAPPMQDDRSSHSVLTNTTTKDLNGSGSDTINAPTIVQLPAGPSSAIPNLRQEIIDGLLGKPDWVVPGNTEEDKKWRFKKSIPTMALYDEQGLRLYDKITEEAPEYYLYQAELNLFKTHAKDIVRAMGIGSRSPAETWDDAVPTASEAGKDQADSEEKDKQIPINVNRDLGATKSRSDRWGDEAVGKWNDGVNGETSHAIPSVSTIGCDIVELGAGSLKKSGVFLNAVADALPPSSSPDTKPFVRYHALDLSLPELKSTLSNLAEKNKNHFAGKIECRGLWGDYDRGIEYIKGGGLANTAQAEGKPEREVNIKEASPTKPSQIVSTPLAESPQSRAEHHTPALRHSNSASRSPTTSLTNKRSASLKSDSGSPRRESTFPSTVRPSTTPKLTAHASPLIKSTPAVVRRTSTSSLNYFNLDGEAEDLDADDAKSTTSSKSAKGLLKGVKHSGATLDAGEWKDMSFKDDLLQILRDLRIPLWSESHIKPANIHLLRISGALTNAVFFCSYNASDEPTLPEMSPMLTPSLPGMRTPGLRLPPTLLIRVYGPSTDTLISRPEELRILHTLSSQYGLGPRIEGTFENGRIEQFFPSRALSAGEIRQGNMSRSIACRMRELHSVDLKALGYKEGSQGEPSVWKSLRDWVHYATEVADKMKVLPEWEAWIEEFGLKSIEAELKTYMDWVDNQPDRGAGRVFSHNDTQYGNILLLDRPPPSSEPEHHKLIVIDFEYAAPNYRGFDIGNHFHEWQANYHHPSEAHSLSAHEPYPTIGERENFYRSYLSVQMDSRDGREKIMDTSQVKQSRINALEREVRIWSPASSAFWALWGVVQAAEQIEGVIESGADYVPDFDYLSYAIGRIQMFRTETHALGVPRPAGAKITNGVTAAALSTQSWSKTIHAQPVHMLFLGSSIGNFDRDGSVPFLAKLPLRPGSGDTLLLGLDGRPAVQVDEHTAQIDASAGKRLVETAYNDPQGHTEAFINHALEVVREEIGTSSHAVELEAFSYAARYNVEEGRHEAYFRSNRAQEIQAGGSLVSVAPSELLNVEWSYKYSVPEALALFERANLCPVQSWKDPQTEYRLWLLQRPPFIFPSTPALLLERSLGPAAVEWSSIPGREEWTSLWHYWDTITLGMIPNNMLLHKPIDLRHKCLFYLGHIPTFLDIHLSRLLKQPHTEPEYYKDIFERGIDPHVDDPTKIHSHSIVPDADEDWPVLKDILSFRDRVRDRVMQLYSDLEGGQKRFTRRTARILWMTFEHEAFHAETLLYMLLQASYTLPPPGFAKPNWAGLATSWDAQHEPNRRLAFEAQSVILGHDDSEVQDHQHIKDDSWQPHEFGWDNEHPRVAVSVPAFEADELPVSNAEYAKFLSTQKSPAYPKSWIVLEGTIKVRTLYGPVSLEVAQHWPLAASYDELAGYAEWKGGRLPTEGEMRVLWTSPLGPRPSGLTSNVGIKRWHMIPATASSYDSNGKVLHGQNGGVWEWTSTVFDGLRGFEPSEVYPGYSLDFFDGLHNVVVGGSYATIPRLAGRSSLRNFYQRAYPYAWTGGRVAYNV